MALLLLPSELLQNISSLTRPDGYESWMLSCRALYEAGKPHLQQHNHLRRTYSYFKYARLPTRPESEGQMPIVSALQLLHEIGQEPLIADYIIDADFRGLNTLGDDPLNRPWLARIQQAVEGSGSIRHLLEHSSYTLETGQDTEEWHRHIFRDQDYAEGRHSGSRATVFLLTLLVNLRCLKLPGGWASVDDDPQRHTQLWPVLDNIVRRANGVDPSRAGLGQLKTLGPSVCAGYDNQTQLDAINPILGLTSLHDLHYISGRAMPWGTSERDFNARYENLGANIKHMDLLACCMGAPECGEFFRKMANLQSLNFSYETKWHGVGHDWEAGDFAASLMAAVGDTLQSLSLTVLNCFGSISPVLTLQGFRRLKHLEIDCRLFLGPPYEDYLSRARQQRPTENYPTHVPTLLSVLPKGLETLQLLACSTSEYNRCLNDIFKGFVDGKEGLPELGTTTILRGLRHVAHPKQIAKRLQVPKNVRAAEQAGFVSVVQLESHLPSDAVRALQERFRGTNLC